jgi:hypothetical protein
MSLAQAEVKSAVTRTDKQLVVLESKLEELNLRAMMTKRLGLKKAKLRHCNNWTKSVKRYKYHACC